MDPAELFSLHDYGYGYLLRLQSADGTNRLTREFVLLLNACIKRIRSAARPVIITGNERIFSAGADLVEIASLSGPAAFEFSRMGQHLMHSVESFPAPVYAAISGYCMGGGLDLALACQHRIASRNAVFGHRGAALGLITGWGGTQRLPRLIGKSTAMKIFLTAEKINAVQGLAVGLVEALADDPVAEALDRIRKSQSTVEGIRSKPSQTSGGRGSFALSPEPSRNLT